MHAYRFFADDAGSLAARSGVHAISGVCWVTQLALLPSGLHVTNIYRAFAGAPGERRKKWHLMHLVYAALHFRAPLSNSTFLRISLTWQLCVCSVSGDYNIILQQAKVTDSLQYCITIGSRFSKAFLWTRSTLIVELIWCYKQVISTNSQCRQQHQGFIQTTREHYCIISTQFMFIIAGILCHSHYFLFCPHLV